MPSLKSLRQRINSAGKIKQITKSMEMIAASRLKKAQDKAVQALPYKNLLFALIKKLPKQENLHPLLK